jgi:hypothetical protein
MVTIEEQTALENNLFLWSYRWHFSGYDINKLQTNMYGSS